MARTPVLLAQDFEFDAEIERLLQVVTDNQHAVVGQQAGTSIRDGQQHGVGQGLCAESRVGGAAHAVATKARDHVVERRDVVAQAGETGGKRRMRMQYRTGIRAPGVEVTMKAPLRGRLSAALATAVHAHVDDILAYEGIVGHARGSDQETRAGAVAGAQAEVAGGAAIEAGRLHAARSVEQRLPRIRHAEPPGTGPAARRCWRHKRRVR